MKRSKRDTDFSRRNLLEMDAEHLMNTGEGTVTPADELLRSRPFLRLDTADLTAEEAARRIVAASGHQGSA